MNKANIILVLLLMLYLTTTLSIWTQENRTEPIDLIIALDKSKSMQKPIESVKTYVNNEIIDKFLIKGDYFIVITFFGQSLIPISTEITDETQKVQLKAEINKIYGDGPFTDIGAALDRLKEELQTKTSNDRKKTLLLLTDGKNEPPVNSKYYSPDGQIFHELLKNTREKEMQGWKIITLGIGNDGAKEISDPLSANYIQTSDNLTPEELKEKNADLAGRVTIIDNPKMSGITTSGNSQLTFTLKSELYSKSPFIVLDAIRLESNELNQGNLLTEEFPIKLPANGETLIKIPLKFKGAIEKGTYKDSLVFHFDSTEKFDPRITVEFKTLSFLESNPWLIILALLIIAIAAALVVLLFMKVILVKSVKVKINIDEHPLGTNHDIFKIRKGQYLFINENDEIFEVSKKSTKNSLAKISSTGTNINMIILKNDRFPKIKSFNNNILESTYTVITTHHEDCHIQFKSA